MYTHTHTYTLLYPYDSIVLILPTAGVCIQLSMILLKTMDVKEVVEQADDSVGTLSCCNTLIYQVVENEYNFIVIIC